MNVRIRTELSLSSRKSHTKWVSLYLPSLVSKYIEDILYILPDNSAHYINYHFQFYLQLLSAPSTVMKSSIFKIRLRKGRNYVGAREYKSFHNFTR